MNTIKRTVLLVVVAAQGDSLPPESAVTPIGVAALSAYSEGMAFDADGFAYASLLHSGQVVRLRFGSPPQVWARVVEPNGHRILPDGTHLIAAKGAVLRLGSDGRLLDTLASQFGAEPLRNP